ncbi:MAG: DNA polymerase III subunit epsilon [Gammaproteobacteria bacterium]
MRQVVLDTETTGLDPTQGHRIIEIGCVEIENRRLTGKHCQCYLNPDRDIDEAAIEVHGLTVQFLADKARFTQVEAEFVEFIRGAELIIHNAPFDLGFLNAELGRTQSTLQRIEDICTVQDSLQLARTKHPGQRNNLDALCKRYAVDNTQRELHGALLDAEILADVYLLMTSGQSSLSLKQEQTSTQKSRARSGKLNQQERPPLRIVKATPEELLEHRARLQEIDQQAEQGCLWLSLNSNNES